MAEKGGDASGSKQPYLTPGPSSSGYEPPAWFWDTRVKGPSSVGAIVFSGLRSLNLPLQLWLLRSRSTISLFGQSSALQAGIPSATTSLGISPYEVLVLGLSFGAASKQIFWNHVINAEIFPAPFALLIGVYNTIFDSLNSGFAVLGVTSQAPAIQSSYSSFTETMPISIPAGLLLYSTGLFIEWYSEVQRKGFKADPRNSGKPYSKGLFSLARNINYTGYTLWRTGYALVCGGWVWASLVFAWNAGDFCTRAIPSMDAYCEKRYGKQWDRVKSEVPYQFLPWIY